MTSPPFIRAALERYGVAWVPIPVLATAIGALWVLNLPTAHESPLAVLLLNFLFTWLVALCVSYVAARGFLVSGQAGLLMLGAGVLLWGLASLAAAPLVSRSGNQTITIHNLGAFGAALCHFGGLLWQRRLQRPGRWLAAVYGGALGGVAVLVWATLAQWTPVFFVQGQGGTPLRQAVLLTTILLFALAGWLMWTGHRQKPSAFLYWYGLGLGLLAVGLTGVWLQSAHGSVLGWTGRLSQYLASVYLFLATLAAARQTGTWKTSLASVQEAWRQGQWLAVLRGRSPWGWVPRYGLAGVAVAVAYGFWLAVQTGFGPGLPPFITFSPAVMVVALLGGLGPGLVATALSEGIVAGWIFPPTGPLSLASPVDRLALVLFGGMGVLMSGVAELYRHSRAKAAAYDRETALRESQARLQALFENMQDGFAHCQMLCDDQGRPVDFVYLDVNCAFGRLTGLENVVGRRATEVLPGIRQDHPELLETYARVVRSGQPERLEFEFKPLAIWLSLAVYRPQAGEFAVFFDNITARKQAEQENQSLLSTIRAEKERLSCLLNSISDEIWFADTNRQFTLANPSAIREFRLSPTQGTEVEKLAASLKVYRGDGSPRPVEEAPPLRALAGEVIREEEEIIQTPATGELRYRQVNAAPVRDPAGQIIGSVSVVRDITERKRAEVALRAGEERLRMVLAASWTGTFEVDLRSGEGRWNDTEFELLGLQPGAAPSQPETFFRYVHPEDLGKLRERWEEALRIGRLDAEFRVVRADGQVRWLAGRGQFIFEGPTGKETAGVGRQPVRFLGVNFDITDRKLAEGELRASERRERERAEDLATVLQAVPMPVFIAHDPDCLHLAGNRAADELLHNPRGAEASLSAPEKVRPRHFRAVKDGRDLRLEELPAQRAARGTEVRDFEFSLVFDDGTTRHVLGYGTPLRDNQGQPRGVVHVLVDITERRRAEEQLRLLNAALEQRVAEAQTANDALRASRRAALNLIEDVTQARHQAEQASAALERAAEQRRLALEGGGLGMWDYRFKTGEVLWDERCRTMWGLPEPEQIDYAAALARIHPADRPGVDDAVQQALAGANAGAYHHEFRVLWPDGSVHWVASHGRAYFGGEGETPCAVRFVGVNLDITTLKQREGELHRLNRSLTAIAKSNEALMRATEEGAYLQAVCRIIVEDCGHAMVWIGMAENDEARSVRPVASAGFDEGYLETLQVTWADTERGRGPTGTAIRTGQACGCRNMLTDPRFAPWREEALRRGYASSLVLPLREAGSTFGALTIYSREPDPFSEHEVGLLTELADDLAYGITILRMRAAHARAEAALRESETRFRNVFDHAAMGIAITDTTGHFVQCNAAYRALTGYTQSELATLESPMLVHPSDRDTTLSLIRRLLDGELPLFAIENRYLRKDGRLVWVHKHVSLLRDERGQPTHLVALVTDTTERTQIEEALRFLVQCGLGHPGEGFFQELARYLAQALAMDFVCIDRLEPDRLSAQTLAVFHNGRFEDNVSYTLKDTPCGQVVGQRICSFPRNVRALFPKDTVLQDLQAESYLGTTLWGTQGQPVGLIAVIGRQPLPDTRLAESILQVVAGRAAAELERQRADAELRRLNAQLEERVRERTAQLEASNRELEAFCYSVSHDLRAPLRGIDGFSQALLEDYGSKLEPGGRDDIHWIRSECQKMGQLIDDLLNLSRVTRAAMAREPVDLTALAHEIAADLQHRAPDRPVQFHIAAGLATVGDGRLLRIVLSNLLENAWKYTGKRDQPVIEVGLVPPGAGLAATDLGPPATHRASPVFFVRDNGAGFDMLYADKLFAPFQRLHSVQEFPGTGIGLATVQRILHRHGGRIWVEAAVGQGVTFFFTMDP